MLSFSLFFFPFFFSPLLFSVPCFKCNCYVQTLSQLFITHIMYNPQRRQKNKTMKKYCRGQEMRKSRLAFSHKLLFAGRPCLLRRAFNELSVALRPQRPYGHLDFHAAPVSELLRSSVLLYVHRDRTDY